MGLLENKHVNERELFCRLLSSKDKYSSQKEEAAICTPQEIIVKMAELRDARLKVVQCEYTGRFAVYIVHLI